jgi:hypothetical protein
MSQSMSNKFSALIAACALGALLICKASAGSASWSQFVQGANEAMDKGDLDAARGLMVNALAEANKSGQLSKDDSDLNAIFLAVDRWRERSIQKARTDGELRNQVAKQESAEKLKEDTDRETRWRSAKSQGKTIDQFDQEERKHVDKNAALAAFRKQLDQVGADNENRMNLAAQNGKLFSLAASVRARAFGSVDAKTKEYEKLASSYEFLRKNLANRSGLFKQNGPGSLWNAVSKPPPLVDFFDSAFSIPITSVKEVKQGGSGFVDTEVWLRFKSSVPVGLVERDLFAKVPDARMQKRFLELVPADSSALSERQNLECLQRKEGKTYYSLLSNKRRELYWYRVSDWLP